MGRYIGVLPDNVVMVEYCEQQRCFHFDFHPNKITKNSIINWQQLGALTIDDAITFAESMSKKYCKGRINGALPELDVVILEFSLFNKLKNSRRKLANR